MRITFGMFLDGADWSEKPAALGEIKMGPLQFLPWLETRLGLGGVSLPEPERIDGYMRKIRRVDPEWCRESFETDSWSTAKQMLAWRDELFENGWDGKSAPSERFKALAAVEADPGLLSPGVPDRMKAILRELETHQFSNMTLALQGPFELLPWMWRQVIGRLWERGMMSAQVPDPPRRPGPKMFQIDGANEFLLARECARFLAAGNNERTALICEGGPSVFVPAHKVKAVDTTAAGDTFCGALCVAVSEGKSLKEAAQFACAASALTVQKMGAQNSIPYRSEINL